MGSGYQRRLDISKVVTITIAYLLLSLFLAIYNHVLVSVAVAGEMPTSYSFRTNLAVNLMTGLVAGVLGGAVFVHINKRIFRSYSMGRALALTAGAYVIVFLIVNLLVSLADTLAILGPGAPLAEILTRAGNDAFVPQVWVFFVLWGFVSLVTLFGLAVSDKFGPGVLRKFVLGQYFHPREEPRIFMFLDMRSSTAIAERLGNEAYFRLLRDCFSAVTPSIVANRGEICQYIGDEILISWTPENGFRNANCLRCFDEIQRALREQSETFESEYGLVPEFKAGLHFGNVIAGEIGDIKKDIVYSGDVLNAAARIQGLCNQYREDFLASTHVLDQMRRNELFDFVPIGEIELRGREHRLAVQAVHFA